MTLYADKDSAVNMDRSGPPGWFSLYWRCIERETYLTWILGAFFSSTLTLRPQLPASSLFKLRDERSVP